METKREKFIRLANKRTNDILDKIRLLENLSNKARYEYHDEDINKIFNEIDKNLREARLKFKTKKNNNKKFKL